MKKEFKFGCNPEGEFTGCNCRSKGGHIHIGYTGWRWWLNEFKQRFIYGWPEYFKEWGLFVTKRWKLHVGIVLGILSIKYGSQLLGHLSTYIY